MVRYTAVSVVSVCVQQAVLFVALFFWAARTSNIVAVCVSAVPSYYLNRVWAWGKTGKSHLMKEVVPFWVMALAGLVLSTWAADFAESHAHQITTSHLGMKLVVMAATVGAFGILWVGKFVVFNKVLFVNHPADLPPALDGRTGIPT